MSNESKHVAVIGAGAAGLVTARELLRAGHSIQVFEQQADVGGVWQYKEEVEDDLLGSTANVTSKIHTSRIHTSMYASLHTNLPRDLMAFLDYSFDSAGGGDDAWPRFPHHTMVCEYLRHFADDFDLNQHIQFGARVLSLKRDDQWRMQVAQGDTTTTHNFDAVAVCNGHYSEPRVPDLPGSENFPGLLMHSHNYRHPEPFRGQTIALLGASASGVDIQRELADVANKIYFCAEAFNELAAEKRTSGNVSRCPLVESFGADGRLTFVDGSTSEPIDTFMYCTGYHFRFPFLPEKLLRVDDNRVQPVFQHLLHIDQPSLALIGLPIRVIPFPLFEMQARWFARLLHGDFSLPDSEAMRASANAGYEALMKANGKLRHIHILGDDQNDYYNLLARQCGEPELPEWFQKLTAAHFANVQKYGLAYRDAPLPQFGPTRIAGVST
jgi:thioredoxin reductase